MPDAGSLTIVGVTLVRDTAANLERFIDTNLRLGLDHLLVFLDDPDNPVPDRALDPRLVTLVRLDEEWWQGRRPESLNRRQRVAANFARVALARLGWADWLVFIDGDEVAALDREVVATIPADVRGFRLKTLEVTSTLGEWDGLFKRQRPPPALRRLQAAGVIPRANNKELFHGHIAGKVGIRPRLDLRLDLHNASDDRGDRLELHMDEGLRVLHLESVTLEEFERKWTAMSTSGSRPGVLGDRNLVLDAFAELGGLGPEERRERVLELFQRYVVDDVEALAEHDVLVRVDLDATTHRARPLTDEAVTALAAQVAELSALHKPLFRPAASTSDLLDRLDR